MAKKQLQIDKLMAALVFQDGSDLHLTVGSPPMIRLQRSNAPTGDKGTRCRRYGVADEVGHAGEKTSRSYRKPELPTSP